MSLVALALAFVCSEDPAVAAATGPALHWPRWRGPTWDGVAAPDASPPFAWSETENLVWKVALPGLGNSTPVVAGDRLYLTAALDLGVASGSAPGQVPSAPQPGPPKAGTMHRSFVLALDRATGRELWRTTVHEGVPHEKGHTTGSHASPSPSTDGVHLVAPFGSRGLFVLDLDGHVLWSKQLGEMETLAGFGEGSTPALHDGLVVVQWDEEGPSFLAAFDVRTGEERWRRARETDSSWGSPVVATVDGRAQVVVTGSDVTRAYDLATGEPVWSCGGMSKNPVNSAVIAGDLAYVTNAYKGDLIQALGLSGAKGTLEAGAGLRWARAGVGSYVPVPVVHDGRLYFLRHSNGVLSCLDAGSGVPVYEGRRLADLKTVHASPLFAAGRLYVVGREGTTAVVKAGDTFDLLATNTLDDVFDASPVCVGAQLFLRGRSHLYCVANTK